MKKIRKEPKKKTLMEMLGDRMVREVYPEIIRALEEIGDTHTTYASEYNRIEFYVYTERKGCEIKISYKYNNSWSNSNLNALWIMNEGKFVDQCPIIVAKRYDSKTYFQICETIISALEDIRKIKLDFSKIMDKIDAIPTKLERKVITEKVL